MYPNGQPQPTTPAAPMQPGAGQPAFPQVQQPTFQPVQPQAQHPVQPAQPEPSLPTFSLPLPNPNFPSQPTHQTAPAAPVAPQADYSQIHQAIASDLGITVDQVQQIVGNDPRGISRLVARAYQTVASQRQQEQVPPSTQTVADPNQAPNQPATQANLQPYKLPPGWEAAVRMTDAGVYEPIHPSYAQIAAAANHNQQIRRMNLMQFGENPASILEHPSVQQLIDQKVADLVNKTVHSQRLQELQDRFLEENQNALFQVDQQTGRPIVVQGSYIPTPMGTAFQQALKQLSDNGMQDSQLKYKLALDMARQQTGQPHPPAAQPGALQQPVQAYQAQQPASDPVRAALEMNSATNRLIPGGAPQRTAAPQRMSLRESFLMATKDMPEGLPSGQYLRGWMGQGSNNGSAIRALS